MSKTISAGHVRTHYTIPVHIRTHRPRPELTVHKLTTYINRLGSGGNHLQWSGLAMLLQSIIITPLVALTIMYTSNWTPLWFVATASMYATFVPTLAGLHIKWTKLVFIINCFVSLLIILTAIVHSVLT